MDNKRTETSAGRAAARTRAFLPPPPSLLLVLLLLLLARCAAAQGPLEYRREISSGNSSLDSARSAVVSVNSIKFTLGPCSGLSPHYQNASELIQPIQGRVHFGYVATNGTLVEADMAIGQLYELPGGQMHFILNPACEKAVFIGVFPLGTTTQFALAALAAVGPTLNSVYAVGALPTPIGMPFSVAPGCAQKCQSEGVYLAAGSDSASASAAPAPAAPADPAWGATAPAPAGR